MVPHPRKKWRNGRYREEIALDFNRFLAISSFHQDEIFYGKYFLTGRFYVEQIAYLLYS